MTDPAAYNPAACNSAAVDQPTAEPADDAALMGIR